MSFDLLQQKRIMDHLILSLEGEAGPEDLQRLKDILNTSSEARDYYLKAVKIAGCIRKIDWRVLEGTETGDLYDTFNYELWNLLAEEERTAEALEISKDPTVANPDRRNITIIKDPSGRRERSKFSLYSLIISSAAMILLLLYVNLAPPRTSVDVATLKNSMEVKWNSSAFSVQNGDRLYTNELLSFSKGVIEIQTDRGVTVTIEGPAEFELMQNADMYFNLGRLYARVSEGGVGFTVTTRNSKVIDLGTEFGVNAQSDGTAELHVFKGKTTLIAGTWLNKQTEVVVQDQARHVSEDGTQVQIIPIQREWFARSIQSRTKNIWRGQDRIDLADIVGGGNGFGTGQFEVGINPVTGMRGDYLSADRQGDGRYIPVTADHYIDGVFVPMGRGDEIISSKGHVFKECPQTNGLFYAEIINGYGKNISDYQNLSLQRQLGGRTYGTKEYPSIFMHANLGITFDLDAIRKDLPAAGISRFTADAGLSSDAPRQGNADVWVLVDGTVRYCQKKITEKGKIYPVTVDLEKSDRFLTLITTDGGDIDSPVPGLRASDSDWVVFARARLELSN